MIPVIPDFVIIGVGTIKDPNLTAATDRYLSLLKHEARITVKVIGDSNRTTEERRLVEQIDNNNCYTFVLSEEGETYGSRQFAEFIGSINRKMAFIIGGPEGLGNEVKKRANKLLSLSPFTFTHEIARMLLAEQLYRACTILHNKNYHRD
jgi:23S rRNA (pseudouridine1915-N3)-methyltransferase